MSNLTATDMLQVWEQGLNQPLLQRALLLLTAASPEMDVDTLTKLSIGQRDVRLVQLRERLFGSKLINTAICPECSERLEWENKVTDIYTHSSQNESELKEFELTIDQYHLRCRLANSLDIADVINLGDKAEAEKYLLRRCVLNAEYAGDPCTIDQLPDDVIVAIYQRMEALDPYAEIRINLHCPSCSYSWSVLFDIASFLWQELNDWAERMLQTIHTLATGYGWSEREILNLSPIRRQLYLGLLRP